MRRLYVTRRYHFNAGHRLYREDRDDGWNRRVYSRCSNAGGHGHNYYVEVTITGSPDPETGEVVCRRQLDSIVHERVLEPFDHRSLNEELELVDAPVPTSEVLALEIWRRLEPSIVPPARLHRVRIHETAKNVFDVCE